MPCGGSALYRDPQLGVEKRNWILKQIQETYLQNEVLLSHFHYETHVMSVDKISSQRDDDNDGKVEQLDNMIGD